MPAPVQSLYRSISRFVIRGLLWYGMIGVAQSQQCQPIYGEQQSVILGPNGEQFYPGNQQCPDQIVAPQCPGGTILRYLDPQDPHHLTRYACLAAPSSSIELPLVVYFHGARATTVDASFAGYQGDPPKTHLLALMSSTSLVPGRTGYALLMIQGRCTTAPGNFGGKGVHHDHWFKDPRNNFDVRATQAFLQQIFTRTTQDEYGHAVPLPAALATVDRKRVYLMGHSNGAFFVHMLMLMFPNQFAAAATAAGGDPYTQVNCQTPYPSIGRRVPLIIVHAACDPLVLCSCTSCDPGTPVVDGWTKTLTMRLGWTSNIFQDVITASDHIQIVSSCQFGSVTRQRLCPASAHEFPNSQLPLMFSFLRRHQLP